MPIQWHAGDRVVGFSGFRGNDLTRGKGGNS